MRLKRDSSSWRASGLAKKYEPESPTKFKSHKNTRKWCTGKPGRLHDYYLVKSDKWMERRWLTFKCQNCGKELFDWLKP